MNESTLILSAVLLLVIVTGLAYYSRQLLLGRRRTQSLRALLENADSLENDLMECRKRLQQAHAVMAATTHAPVRTENQARDAVDSGLRSLLLHRLWVRDHAENASQEQLDAAVDALRQARRKMEPQLDALGRAQHDLNQAVRKQIERDTATS